MIKKRLKSGNIFVFALIFILSIIWISTSSVYASSGSKNIIHKVSTATVGTPIRYNFTLSKKSDLLFVMKTSERIGCTIAINDPNHDIPIQTVHLSTVSKNMEYLSDQGIYRNSEKINLDAGNYVLELQFENDTNFDFTMDQVSSGATLKNSNLTVTKGFTGQISVVNGGTIKSCTSNKPSVASVTNKGKITGKKNGNVVIKVKLTSGKVLNCKVSVVSNQYTSKKIDTKDIEYNTCKLKPYQASFDSKGNIVVKFLVVNNNYGVVSELSNYSITIKDIKKTTIAAYKKNAFPVNVPSYGTASYTVKIPKSSLKVKQNKIDLRTCTFTISSGIVN